jgi:hypothetical protein
MFTFLCVKCKCSYQLNDCNYLCEDILWIVRWEDKWLQLVDSYSFVVWFVDASNKELYADGTLMLGFVILQLIKCQEMKNKYMGFLKLSEVSAPNIWTF